MRDYIRKGNRIINVLLIILLGIMISSCHSLTGNDLNTISENDYCKIMEQKMESELVLTKRINEYCEIRIECNMFEIDVLSISLFVKNKSNMTIAIPRILLNIFDEKQGLMTNEYIEISNEKGDNPFYSGILMKINLEDVKIDDCIIFKPKQEIKIDIPNLFDSYDMNDFNYKWIEIIYIGPLGVSNKIVLPSNAQ